MANDVSVLIPKVLARALPVLRQHAITPKLVNRSYDLQPRQRGYQITVPIGQAATVSNVTPGPTPPTPQNTTPTSVLVSLDKWKYSDFALTDQEMTRIEAERDFIPVQAQEAIKGLVNTVDSDLLATYKGVYNYVGTAGTTPFASDASLWAGKTGARNMLNKALAPNDQRFVLLDPDAEAQAMSLSPFQDASKRGSAETIITGQVGYVQGALWGMNQNIPSHTAGAPGAIQVAGAHLAGATSLAVDTGDASGTLKEGDVFTIAGQTTQYVVTADVTLNGSGAGTLAISPALSANVSDNAAITLKATHVVNLAFHRDAFALAFAPIADVMIPGAQGAPIAAGTIQDPLTGIILRLQVVRQWMQTAWVFDVAYGVKLVRAPLAVRIAG